MSDRCGVWLCVLSLCVVAVFARTTPAQKLIIAKQVRPPYI